MQIELGSKKYKAWESISKVNESSLQVWSQNETNRVWKSEVETNRVWKSEVETNRVWKSEVETNRVWKSEVEVWRAEFWMEVIALVGHRSIRLKSFTMMMMNSIIFCKHIHDQLNLKPQ